MHRRHGAGAETFLKELGWREFCHQLLFHNPDLPEQAFRPALRQIRLASQRRQDFHAWTKGQTGIPIVDAGMRQLWQTGWMHNRVRMIAASLPDQASGHRLAARRGLVLGHAGGCRSRQQCRQLAMGGGLRRRCRAVLPHLQSGAAGREIRSRTATYVRRFVPELKAVPDKYVHQALGRAPAAADYPHPIVDLAAGRERALKAFKALKG